ncbi:hypothetical protein GDO81_006529 [Engystomops pustulosus]|uniref:Uncharacterized protein n=1 Tax=Engystomops pustulosus TaxID=76066 RepID=A0AAV7CXB4_ENGPU|nr:hypothetical protein GDO81_006529 [Engystomops pustulosus]
MSSLFTLWTSDSMLYAPNQRNKGKIEVPLNYFFSIFQGCALSFARATQFPSNHIGLQKIVVTAALFPLG